MQKRYYNMVQKYLDSARANFDWNGPEANANTNWQSNFGSRACRELVKWLRESRFNDQVAVEAIVDIDVCVTLLC
jgi:hypothetical protein